MRRPKRTLQQRVYELQQRRMRALQRAAVRLFDVSDEEHALLARTALEAADGDASDYYLAMCDLASASQRWVSSLSTRERARLAK